MPGTKLYFFDTYALLAIILGDKNYSDYKSDVKIITTKLNLLEMHFALLRVTSKEKADKYFYDFLKYCVKINVKDYTSASFFRKKNKPNTKTRTWFSYVDSIGYIISSRLKVPFLTGDQGFKDYKNVEFVGSSV